MVREFIQAIDAVRYAGTTEFALCMVFRPATSVSTTTKAIQTSQAARVVRRAESVC